MINSFDKTILKILDITDDDSIFISDIEIEDDIKAIHIERKPSVYYCPICGTRLHSKGIYKRKINHPILQDHSELQIIVHQRKWKCPNCNTYSNESFPFLERYKHSSTFTPLLILDAMKDLNASTVSIANRFHVSDTYVHDIFTAYVDLSRLPLTEYISVDEVHMNINNSNKYAFIIMDFISGQIIDIVHNRWAKTLEDYFLNIPLEERKKVKVLISDAYAPYLDIPKKYLPNARSVLDSFHVVKYLIKLLNDYINNVYRKYRNENKKMLDEMNQHLRDDQKTMKESKEMILLRDYRWVILKNNSEINYSTQLYYHKRLGMNIDTYRIESMFFSLDKNFKIMRDLKEEYITFNQTRFETEEEMKYEFNRLIKKYSTSNIKEFELFSKFLTNHQDEIFASFTMVKTLRKSQKFEQEFQSRVSNGPMESFNRKPKDLKRNSRGFSNFDYTRNRILWSTRNNPTIRGIPKTNEQIHSYAGTKRGSYKK